MKPETHFRS